MKIKVYIASPYTKGDRLENVRRQVEVAHDLRKFGVVPFVPLLSHYAHEIQPEPYDIWLSEDFEWIAACNALLRLPGESKGADAEVTFAWRINIPVFYDVNELISWKEKHAKPQADYPVLIE